MTDCTTRGCDVGNCAVFAKEEQLRVAEQLREERERREMEAKQRKEQLEAARRRREEDRLRRQEEAEERRRKRDEESRHREQQCVLMGLLFARCNLF